MSTWSARQCGVGPIEPQVYVKASLNIYDGAIYRVSRNASEFFTGPKLFEPFSKRLIWEKAVPWFLTRFIGIIVHEACKPEQPAKKVDIYFFESQNATFLRFEKIKIPPFSGAVSLYPPPLYRLDCNFNYFENKRDMDRHTWTYNEHRSPTPMYMADCVK